MKRTGTTKLKQVAKSALAGPVPQGGGPLHHPQEVLPESTKRKPGRPRKVVQHLTDPIARELEVQKGTFDPKALVTFRRAIADAEKLLMNPAEADGGGTPDELPIVAKESLQRRVTRRLNVIDRYMTDDKLIELLSFCSLKDIGIYEGILLDKSQVLSGNPNVIIGSDERARINEVMPRLMTELKRRGLITTMTERKVEFASMPDVHES